MRVTTLGGVLAVIGLCAGCATQRIGLDAGSATLQGNLRYSAAEQVLCYWNGLDQSATWTATIPESGEYNVSITYGCDDSSSGSEVTVAIGEKVLTKTVGGTSGWHQFTTEKVGCVSLSAGSHIVKITPTKKPGAWVMDLKEITLTKK